MLNGAPRSGKSSIAAAIQATFDGVWVNLGVDHSMAATPERSMPGIGLRPGGERPELEPIVAALYRALYGSVVAHAQQGLSVVVDVGHHDGYANPLGTLRDAARRLEGLPALLVGVRCPIDVVMERRQATGMAAPGEVVERWEREVHSPGIYDLEVDTSAFSPEACAKAIQRRLEGGVPFSAFRRIGARMDVVAIDLKGFLEERIRGAAELWTKDLQAHREEHFASAAAESARSVADIGFETICVNRRIVARLRGETVAPMDGFPTCPEELRSLDALAKAMTESAEEILAAVGDPAREIVRPDGTTVSAFDSAEFAAVHMYYHLGQVNYIQTVYGDPAIHWM